MEVGEGSILVDSAHTVLANDFGYFEPLMGRFEAMGVFVWHDIPKGARYETNHPIFNRSSSFP